MRMGGGVVGLRLLMLGSHLMGSREWLGLHLWTQRLLVMMWSVESHGVSLVVEGMVIDNWGSGNLP